MSIRSIVAASILSALASACGGGGADAGSGTVTGTLLGNGLNVSEVPSATGVEIATFGSLANCSSKTPCTTQGERCIAGSCGSASGHVAAVTLTPAHNLCAIASKVQEPKSSQYLVLVLAELSNTLEVVAPTTPGLYAVVPPGANPSQAHFSKVLFQTTDATCQSDAAHTEPGVTGTVQLTRVDSKGFSGTYDLTLQHYDASGKADASPDHVTGTFSSVDCPGLGGLIATDRETTCI